MRAKYSRGWLVLLALVCTNASPTRRDESAVYDYAPFTNQATSTENKYEDFENTPAKKYSLRSAEDEASVERFEREELLSGTGSAPLPRVPEPDAEMLPAHYTGVQPPGVDHMELRTSQVAFKLASDRKSGPTDGTKMATRGISGTASGRVQLGELDEFEEYPATEGAVKDLRKSGHAKDARKKMTCGDVNGSFDEARGDVTSSSEAAALEHANDWLKDENGAGYGSPHRRDENKKKAHFYDKDCEGGPLRDHGQYGEKHAGRENNFHNFEIS